MIATTDTFDQFYIMSGGEKLGPFTLGQMIEMWRNRQINGQTSYWQDGMEQWGNLSEIAECFAPQRYQAAIERARNAAAASPPQYAPSRNPDDFAKAVWWGLTIPVVGLVYAIRYLMVPEYRGAGGALIAICFAGSIVWTAIVEFVFWLVSLAP